MRRTLLAALCSVLLLAGLSGTAIAKRVALVIGNDSYKSLPVLQKAGNDARAVAASLDEIGFKVFLGENLTRRQTNRKLADFEAAIEPGDEAFFFFAGHGVALGAENYLIPSDMPKPGAGESGLVRDEAHSVSSLVQRVQRKGAISSFFVLDACRDNPFAAAGVRSIGGTRGLTRVEAPTGVFVLFSAGIGQTALDRLSDTDANPNSVFTRKLIPLLETSGLTHVRLAKQVQKQVSALASTVSHSQQPAYYDQIIGDIVLKPADPNGQAQAPSAKPAASSSSQAANAWGIIQGASSPAVLKAFIASFPDSVYAEFARARLGELENAAPSTGSQQKLASRGQSETATDPDEDTNAAGMRPGENKALVRAIQAELNRHRCDAGTVDGTWGAKSRTAVASFARYTKQPLDPVPSEHLLSVLRSTKAKGCPPPITEAATTVEQPQQAAPLPANKIFRSPMLAGMPIDICLTKSKRCKGAAARVFCERQGYRVATASKFVILPATRHIGSGDVCKPFGLQLCGGYSMIACAR